MIDRQTLIEKFLEKHHWKETTREPITGDASPRRYTRLKKGDKIAILMDAAPAEESAACPKGASDTERQFLGYNALARLAGPNMHAFLAITDLLRGMNLHAPNIFAAQPADGIALIEDLGDGIYAKEISQGASEETLYKKAIDALIHIQVNNFSLPCTEDYSLLSYDNLALKTEAQLLIEWYWPWLKGENPPQNAVDAFNAAIDSMLAPLSRPSVLVLRDYHAENLLWLPEAQGLSCVGLIDYQDALLGHAAYDLASLLEDARRDVSDQSQEVYLAYYKTQAADKIINFNTQAFDTDYAILAAQRNAKILGIFARLVIRDKKPKYEQLMPRVKAHFQKDLQRAAALPLATWTKEYLPELLN